MASIDDKIRRVFWVSVHEALATDSTHATALCSEAAEILHEEWPTDGGPRSRVRQITRSRAEFPASFLLLQGTGNEEKVVGHVSLRPAAEIADGLSAIAYSVIVAPCSRRCGLGKILMKHAEDEARLRGFSYLYLFTDDQQVFYETCGYSVCERIAAVGAVAVKYLSQPGELEGLQKMLAAQAARALNSNRSEGVAESITDRVHSDGSIASEKAVWLRKALVESTLPQPTLIKDDIDCLVAAAKAKGQELFPTAASRELEAAALSKLREVLEISVAKNSLVKDSSLQAPLQPSERQDDWTGILLSGLTWERQVGPSCGLALLRIIRRFLAEHRSDSSTQKVTHDIENASASLATHCNEAVSFLPTRPLAPDASLLAEAKARGYSHEGEMFNIRHMVRILLRIWGKTSFTVFRSLIPFLFLVFFILNSKAQDLILLFFYRRRNLLLTHAVSTFPCSPSPCKRS